MSLPFYQIS